MDTARITAGRNGRARGVMVFRQPEGRCLSSAAKARHALETMPSKPPNENERHPDFLF